MDTISKFVFIDRDGVINRDPQEKLYVTSWADFHFLPGSVEALKKLTERGYKIAIISNQAGVSKGIYTMEKLNEITQNMLKELNSGGASIYSVQYCIHRDTDNCDCRKPRIGLFKKAAEGINVNFGNTYFVGDTKSDIEAGKAIGCKTILVLSGKTKNAKEANDWPSKPDFIVKNLQAAVSIIKFHKAPSP